jgi:hypothetical protein
MFKPFLILLLSFVNSAFAGEFVGLTIEYKAGTSKVKIDKELKAQDLKLIYRSRYENIDQLSYKTNEAYFLGAICKKLLTNKFVVSCSLTKKSYELEYANCPKDFGIPIILNESVDFEVAKSSFTCPGVTSMSTPSEDIKATSGAEFSFGKVTEFWAQEAVGAPEARELMDKLNKKGNLDKVKIGLIAGHFDTEGIVKDIGVSKELSKCIEDNPISISKKGLKEECGVFDTIASILGGGNNSDRLSHGTSVAHLIANKSSVGVGVNAEIHSLATADGSTYLKAFDKTLDNLNSDDPSALINMSMGVPTQYKKLINKLADKAVLVIASGNEFPDPIEVSKRDKTPPKIIVGSIAPDGTHSTFSREGEGVTVVAPSDIFIRSKRGDGTTDELFGGTSGATPVVSGALSNVMSLLPGIKTKELQKMIDKTSIQTHANLDNDGNGAGSINAYALLLAANRLKKDWPRNRRQLRGRVVYNFKRVARKLKKRAKELLEDNLDCDKRKEALKLLRRAFFINPKDKKTRRLLAGIYKLEGYHSQAKFYGPPEDLENDEKVNQRKLNRQLIIAVKDGDIKEIKNLMEQGADILTLGGKHSGDFGSNHLVAIASRLIDDPKLRNETINILIENGAKAMPMATFGKLDGSKVPTKMFDWALKNGRGDLVEKWVLSDNPDEKLNINETVNGETLITIAFKNKESKLSKVLISKGADMYDTSFGYNSPMSVSIQNGDLEAVKLLMDNGYDLNKFDFLDGDIDWWFANMKTDPEIEKYLKGHRE